MRADEGLTSAAVATGRPTRGVRLRWHVGTGVFWLLGSAVVTLAQPGADRRLAALGTAAVAIAAILLVSVLTEDTERRYCRSLIAGMIAVPVASTWLLEHIIGKLSDFATAGFETRIGLPLMFVLFAPLVAGALPDDFRRPYAVWERRAVLVRQARPMDWIVLAYVALIVPGLALGIAHHASKTYIAQDLGLVVFFAFMYLAARLVAPEAARASAGELTALLLLLGIANVLFLGQVTPPLYTFLGAACAAAVGFLILRPRDAGLLSVGLAVVLLVNQAVAVRDGSGSTTAVELAGALAVLAYLAVRRWRLLPLWLVVALAVVGLVGFVGFTADGRTLQGQYQGFDPSNTGRTFEAEKVRSAVKSSPSSLVLGRGFGATIDETQAPVVFQQSLLSGGRDLAHVQEVHLLPFEFLLKNGLLGFVWLGAFVVALAVLGVGALEMASSRRDPSLIIYGVLPLIGLAVGLSAATHVQVNPLNAFSIGVLSTSLARKRSPVPRPAVTLAAAALACAALGAVVLTRPLSLPSAGPMSGARVDDLLFSFPLDYHVRYFTSSDPAVTGARGTRVHGVVVASYPLEKSPEFGALGSRLRRFGVLFELYRAPRHLPGRRPRPVALPLSISDLHAGPLFFTVNGHNYQAIAWADKDAPNASREALYALVSSIQTR